MTKFEDTKTLNRISQEEKRGYPVAQPEFTNAKKNLERLYVLLCMYSRTPKGGKGTGKKDNYVMKNELPVSAMARKLGKGRSAIYKQLDKMVETGNLEILEDRYILKTGVRYERISKLAYSQLLNVANDDVITIYAHLVNTFKYFTGDKKDGGLGKKFYYFSQTKLITDVLGLTNCSDNHNKVRDILNSLIGQGFIVISPKKYFTKEGNFVFIMTSYNDRMTQNNNPLIVGKTENAEEVQKAKGEDNGSWEELEGAIGFTEEETQKIIQIDSYKEETATEPKRNFNF